MRRPACLLAALLVLALPAVAGDAAPGSYAALGGWGELRIQGPPGQRKFSIETFGANGHTCGLEGRVVNGTGVMPASEGLDECRIRLMPAGGGYDVEALTREACRNYCGMRGHFEYEYRPLPAACAEPKRKARREAFLREYQAKRYAKALPTLQALRRDCGRFEHWIEADAIANDLAITLYHLRRPAECLAVLRETQAWALNDAEAVDAALPPLEAEAYRDIAGATRTNRKLCERASSPRQPRS